MARYRIFAAQFVILNFTAIMDNIQNTRGKGYCMLYLAMGLFFVISLLLMLYNRNFILDFTR
jgi:hypothetical protein